MIYALKRVEVSVADPDERQKSSGSTLGWFRVSHISLNGASITCHAVITGRHTLDVLYTSFVEGLEK